MAGTLSKDMRDMPTLCIPVPVFMNEMARIFSANRNPEGEYVYNHAGIEPRTGASNKYVVFADVKHRMLNDYVPTKNSPHVLKVEIVNEESYVEVSATITEAIGRFVPPGRDKQLLMGLAAHPNGITESVGFTLTDRNGLFWPTRAVRRLGVAPYFTIDVITEGQLRDLMNSLFDLDPDYKIDDIIQAEMD
jgi:hypothetical protein